MRKTSAIARIICALLVLASVCAAFAGCSSEKTESGKPSVVVTVFPIYDWVKQIAGDSVDITFLLDRGVDMHSYQPNTNDVIRISTADLFIYVGGESDAWVDYIIDSAKNPKLKTLNLIDELGDLAKQEEIKEGMQARNEDHEEPEYDEHIWLSLKNASFLCGTITDALAGIDPDRENVYRENFSGYVKEIEALDAEYERTIGNASYKTVLFCDRFPFRYLADDYDLDYYAAYAGCSADSFASFETVTFLAAKLDELGLPAILQIETSDGQLARTVRDVTKRKNQKILTLDSLQSSVKKDLDAGKSYLGAMKNNLEILKEALG